MYSKNKTTKLDNFEENQESVLFRFIFFIEDILLNFLSKVFFSAIISFSNLVLPKKKLNFTLSQVFFGIMPTAVRRSAFTRHHASHPCVQEISRRPSYILYHFLTKFLMFHCSNFFCPLCNSHSFLSLSFSSCLVEYVIIIPCYSFQIPPDTNVSRLESLLTDYSVTACNFGYFDIELFHFQQDW